MPDSQSTRRSAGDTHVAAKAMSTGDGESGALTPNDQVSAPLVALIEDDTDQSSLYSAMLREGGFRTEVFANAATFRQRLPAGDFDAVLVDWVLPDESGVELVRWLRESEYSHLPVLMLSRLDADADVVEGLSAGADDYVIKPPRKGELAARMRAHLRRLAPGPADEPIADTEPYLVDPRARRITLDGEPIRLTTREMALALYLFRRAGRVVSRRALLKDVWHLEDPDATRTVDTHVSRVRRKLGLTGAHGWQLNSVYQHGYRLERG